jgi:hypothetical protein
MVEKDHAGAMICRRCDDLPTGAQLALDWQTAGSFVSP